MTGKSLAILLSRSTYKNDNGYLGIVIGVFGVFHPRTHLNDALIVSYRAEKRTLDNREGFLR